MRTLLLVMGFIGCWRFAAADCSTGDLPCACKAAGGTWRDLKTPLKPVCTFEFKQKVNGQDMTRYFNVFLPAGFSSSRQYPVWMHIHGVYWGSMDNISQRMGWNVLAMDATANWDGLVGSSKTKASAIVVYPQSTPSPYTNPDQRMLWSLPWWRCSSGSCVDSNINELEYIETVMRAVLAKFSVDRSKIWVTGTSAGGMMVNYLLCKSEFFQRTATAVVDMLGGVGESFLNQCNPKVHVPHLILHGQSDPVITYWNDNIVDGSNFISTLKMAKWWQKLRGCPGEPRSDFSDNILECSVYCERGGPKMERSTKLSRKEGAKQSSSKAILKLCGMKGVGHDLNTPYQGYPFDIAWEFLKKQSGMQ